MNACKCGHRFQTKLAPCPAGLPGCCVAHYDEDSYKCPECGHDLGPEISKAIMEGRITYEVGISVMNLKSVAKLELYTKE